MVDWENLLVQVLLVAFFWVLPASIWGHLLYPKEKLAMTFSLGLVLTLATLPLAVAVAASLLGVPPSVGLTAIVSSVATLAGLTGSLARMRNRTKESVE